MPGRLPKVPNEQDVFASFARRSKLEGGHVVDLFVIMVEYSKSRAIEPDLRASI